MTLDCKHRNCCTRKAKHLAPKQLPPLEVLYTVVVLYAWFATVLVWITLAARHSAVSRPVTLSLFEGGHI